MKRSACRSLTAFPNCQVIVIKHHRASARGHLRESIGQNRSDQADINGKCRIDVFVKGFRNLCHDGAASYQSVMSFEVRTILPSFSNAVRASLVSESLIRSRNMD